MRPGAVEFGGNEIVDPLEQSTVIPVGRTKTKREPLAIHIVIAHHHDARRLGETWSVPLGPRDHNFVISRAEPSFSTREGRPTQPLMSPYVSRKPLRLAYRALSSSLVIDPSGSSTVLCVDGQRCTEPTMIPEDRLDAGVLLSLSDAVLLWVCRAPAALDGVGPATGFGMVGSSPQMRRVRRRVQAIANADEAALIRGETGSGKELVAQAIHVASARRDAPMKSINVGAVPSELASSTLFGHVRGAFSGASESRRGLFEQAHRGVLFLDEVGDAPDSVQLALLRVLETGELQRVGADRTVEVDVRVIAATDAELESAVETGRFRSALYYRLSQLSVEIPPLRDRRGDIAMLLHYFLRQQLTGPESALWDETERWLPTALIERLMLYRWPGNVRQLRNVASAIALGARNGDPLHADDPELDRLLPSPSAAPTLQPAVGPAGEPAPAPAPVIAPSAEAGMPNEARVEAVMEATDYQLAAACRILEISRPTLTALVDAHPRLVRAKDLSAEDIRAALAQHHGNIDGAWRQLRVARRSLRLRMRELKMPEADS